MQIQTAITTAHHPQANGLVERTNRTIKDTLAILAENHPMDWDTQIPFVQLALNTAIHKSINAQPLFLFTGHSCHIPSGLVNKHSINYGENYPAEVEMRMRNSWKIATETSNRARNNYIMIRKQFLSI